MTLDEIALRIYANKVVVIRQSWELTRHTEKEWMEIDLAFSYRAAKVFASDRFERKIAGSVGEVEPSDPFTEK